MKYLVIGLGNIGEEYNDTRHNIGFKVLDAFVEASNTSFKADRFGQLATVKFRGRTILLLKPDTFMNLSGRAVKHWMNAEKIKSENVLIITDDLALPFGKLRLRGKGSDGGHNGLKSIIQEIGHQSFPRLRFGIASNFSKGSQVNYVLGKWEDEELQSLGERIEICCDLIKSFTYNPLGRIMSEFNAK